MKKFRKLVPAFAMLLVSATVLASTTFAWFSMNNKVTATGMEVTAKANTQYLVIAKTAAEITGKTATTVTLAQDKMTVTGGIAGDTTKVYPVSKNGSTPLTGNGVNIAADAWYTANSNQYDVSGGSTAANLTNAKTVTFGTADYFRCFEFYIGLTQDSTADFNGGETASADKKLKITASAVEAVGDSVTSAVKAAVKVGNGDAATITEALFSPDGTIQIPSFVLKKDTPVRVQIYLYIDGTDANVKDSNATKLAGKMDFTLELVG